MRRVASSTTSWVTGADAGDGQMGAPAAGGDACSAARSAAKASASLGNPETGGGTGAEPAAADGPLAAEGAGDAGVRALDADAASAGGDGGGDAVADFGTGTVQASSAASSAGGSADRSLRRCALAVKVANA